MAEDDMDTSATSSYTNGVNIVTVCLVTLLTYFIYTTMRRPHGLPPGPMTLPLIGNILREYEMIDTLER